jgi:hypothetical protein
MTRIFNLYAVLILVLLIFSCHQTAGDFKNAFEFMTAADMRNYIMNVDSSTRHFMGALEAMKNLGPGSFLISTGDIDPPGKVRSAIDSILGEEYPWYPVIGNHEIEDEKHVEYLRNYNKNGKGLVNLIRNGPPGCEETTYSFEWENCHFVVLNQYYDGKSDMGTDGDVVPELLEWLEKDLVLNQKKYIFVFGHEPIFSMPDMDSGRVRHFDNSLNKYMDNNVAFLQLLRKYEVIAYICGHSHNTSYANINGLWQLDTGHSRGLEGISPGVYFPEIISGINKNLEDGLDLERAVEKFYSLHSDQKDIQKGLEYMNLTDILSYKELSEKQVVEGLTKFYLEAQKGQDRIDELVETFWENANYAASTFIKFYVGKNKIKAEFYRDDGRGGVYSLRKILILS